MAQQRRMQRGSSSRGKQRQVVVEYIQRQVNELPTLCESCCCIYRVPKLLRDVNPKAYTPIAIPIGPLHQENYGRYFSSSDAPDLFCSEHYKLKCLKSFLDNRDVELERCLDIVSTGIHEIRACYAHSVKIFDDNDNDNDNELFTEMVLTDSAFIIELFRDKMKPREQRDSMWLSLQSKDLARDITLAENQMPLFILEELCYYAYKQSFMEFALPFFKINPQRLVLIREKRPRHLLDMFRISLHPYEINAEGNISPETRRHQVIDVLAMFSSGNRDGKEIDRQEITCPTATMLYEAGVKFQVKKNAISLLDITFDNGVLCIPKLKVDDDTEFLFRNLIAFEKSRTKELDNYITDYIFFLDCLISTPTDVHLLTKASIIENWLGSDKNLSELINSMGKHAYDFSKGYCYTKLTQQLNTYHKIKWHRHIAILKQVYFSHPWATIAVVYAAVLLLLTIIQATGSFIDIIHTAKGNKDNK